MIYGNINYQRKETDQKIKKCLAYLEQEDLSQKAPGRYEIKGNDIFVNIVTYETAPEEQKEWEAHRQYIDIHCVLAGKEQIDTNFIDNMIPEHYQENKDNITLTGEKSASVIISPGDYVICYPEDAHKPGIQAGHPETIKKAIFKVKI